MGDVPVLITDLALILTLAGITTLLFKRLKQPLVLGYVLAGFLAGPHMPYTPSVSDMGDIKTWSDIGVIFLLFSLGLEFSFKKIVKMGAGPIIAAISVIFFMICTGVSVGYLFGWSQMDCLFLGGMLAMSSTTIIYKAFDDLGLRQQRFTNIVLSVLVLEDILAILLMVVLSTLAASSEFEGLQMLESMLNLGYFLILWFVVGIFIVPWIFKKARPYMSNETLLIVSLAFCFLLVLYASYVGFSSAFGAFMMGSILSETMESEHIEKVLSPVKDLFGAIFFVSVGMLVDPAILIQYWLPILMITLAILFGQAVFGSFSFILAGQPLKEALKCGFSMAQIGEFAFIIASLGVSLKVTSSYLYPVVVAVSVITTFLTPYMIRLAEPAGKMVEKMMPHKFVQFINRYATGNETASVAQKSEWHSYLWTVLRTIVVYVILSVFVIVIIQNVLEPLWNSKIPEDLVSFVGCGVTLLCISPFLWAIVIKWRSSKQFEHLWVASRINKLHLVSTIVARFLISQLLVAYVVYYYFESSIGVVLAASLFIVGILIESKQVGTQTKAMEKAFLINLHAKDQTKEYTSIKKSEYVDKFVDRDIHLAMVQVPMNSKLAGRTLSELNLGHRFGVQVSAILRGTRRLNIPKADDLIFPGDKIQAIGSDEQLTNFAVEVKKQVYEMDATIKEKEMKLRQIMVTANSPICGKSLRENNMRNKYHCMVIGIERGEKKLRVPDLDTPLKDGDLLWIVGEIEDMKKLIRV